jgi:predicted metalloendopeptidase
MSKRLLSAGCISVVVCVLALALAGLGLRASSNAADKPASWGFDTANLDKSCKPCDDFYQFAMGGWMKANPIPPEYSTFGSFTRLADQNQQNLRNILEDAAKAKAAPGSNEQKIGDFYAGCMDTTAIDAAGTKPLEPELERIANVTKIAGLQAEAEHLHSIGAGALFRFTSRQDLKDSSVVIGTASQGGLGLPERDYYLKDDDKSRQLRDAYVKHIANMFGMLGDPADQSAAEATAILKIETALAAASTKNTDLRDPEKNYHMMTLADLKRLTPNFSWEAYFRGAGHPELKQINVGQPEFFKALDAQLTATPLDDWKIYLRWHLLNTAAQALPEKFVAEEFDFRGKTLTGAKEIQPRWKRCAQATDRALGEALGQVYVQRYFPPESKARALEMVNNLIAALRDDLQTISWMGPATRAQATAKLQAFAVKIGYTDKWRDYSSLKIDRSSYLQNGFRAAAFEAARRLDKIGKPVDRTEWGMTPPTVNAYNSSSMNEIVFPAGIMQPPFYDPKADDAVNYGGMGAVIGHEITHGFDDEGSKFDGHGNLRDWWTAEDRKNFDERASCVQAQFDGYEVEPGLHQNGKLVLGESIADLGGLAISYAAYEKSLEGKPRPQDIEGFTPEQRFFLGWAQVWGANQRPEAARLQTKTNPHPLSRFRGIGAPSNLAEFAKAFGCKKGDPMVREHACKIW